MDITRDGLIDMELGGKDRASSGDKRHDDSTTHLLHGNLCYGEDLEGEGGDYRCPRMGSFCEG